MSTTIRTTEEKFANVLGSRRGSDRVDPPFDPQILAFWLSDMQALADQWVSLHNQSAHDKGDDVQATRQLLVRGPGGLFHLSHAADGGLEPEIGDFKVWAYGPDGGRHLVGFMNRSDNAIDPGYRWRFHAAL